MSAAAHPRRTQTGQRRGSSPAKRRAGAGLLLALMVMAPAFAAAAQDRYATVAGGEFRSTLRYDDIPGDSLVAPFQMMATPVTNAQFLAFVEANPEWQRGSAAPVFVDAEYLSHWQGPVELGDLAHGAQPVTRVSWFAASAFCESDGGSLPSWQQWEYAASADELRTDARSDPAWRERILAWYARPSGSPLPHVGATPANIHGLRDLHGLVWEWVDDYASMLVSGDNRKQNDSGGLQFCGAAALSMEERENYAVMMRVALLSSLQGATTTRNLGFRCVRNTDGEPR